MLHSLRDENAPCLLHGHLHCCCSSLLARPWHSHRDLPGRSEEVRMRNLRRHVCCAVALLVACGLPQGRPSGRAMSLGVATTISSSKKAGLRLSSPADLHAAAWPGALFQETQEPFVVRRVEPPQRRSGPAAPRTVSSQPPARARASRPRPTCDAPGPLGYWRVPLAGLCAPQLSSWRCCTDSQAVTRSRAVALTRRDAEVPRAYPPKCAGRPGFHARLRELQEVEHAGQHLLRA